MKHFGSFRYLNTYRKKFERKWELKPSYSFLMSDYSDLAHMSLLNLTELNITPNYYVPYHLVTNDNSATK